MHMLKIENLKKTFKGKEVLKGVNIEVPEHSIFGFIGKNGSGKTTTMKAILGLIKIDEGIIKVNGELVAYGANKTNKYIGYLPDVPEFYDYMNAQEYLNLCGEALDLDKDLIKERSNELLMLVGLNEEKGRIKTFSRGMKQRLGIAQALLGKPKLLICDEPTSALDPVGRKEILDILKSVKNDTTVIFSTHILSDVEKICTHVAFLDEGIIKLQSDMDSLRNESRSNEYMIEFINEEEGVLISKLYSLESISPLVYKLKNELLNKVLNHMLDHHIKFEKIVQIEKDLESFFMEVIT